MAGTPFRKARLVAWIVARADLSSVVRPAKIRTEPDGRHRVGWVEASRKRKYADPKPRNNLPAQSFSTVGRGDRVQNGFSAARGAGRGCHRTKPAGAVDILSVDIRHSLPSSRSAQA